MGRLVGLSVVLVVLVLVGCGEEPEWVGTYSLDGTWKLSGPLEGNRSVGEATAELMCDELAGALPVPSFVESKVKDWLESAVGDTVASTVDGNMPPELAPGGKLTLLLGQALAAVQVESTLKLEGDDDELKGKEEVTALEYTINGKDYRVAATALGDSAGISASWKGKGGASKLSIDRHTVGIHYGELVQLVAADLLDAAELSSIQTQLSTALGCAAIVDAILGGDSGLKISVVGWSHTVSRSDLEKVCASTMSLVEQQALGQFKLDTPVEVGGGVLWSRVEETGSVTLQSDSDFGGVINVVPDAFAPKVTIDFTGERME